MNGNEVKKGSKEEKTAVTPHKGGNKTISLVGVGQYPLCR